MDVASKMMTDNGMTLKFTMEDLQDSISQNNCGAAGDRAASSIN